MSADLKNMPLILPRELCFLASRSNAKGIERDKGNAGTVGGPSWMEDQMRTFVIVPTGYSLAANPAAIVFNVL